MSDIIATEPTLGFADVVIDFRNSGAGPIDDGPYGGTYNESTLTGSFPIDVSLTVVLGDDPGPSVDFLSLPTDSYVTVGFVDEVIVDGDGDDIFVTEVAGTGELADIFVRAGNGPFQLLGRAEGGTTASFDLADIGFTGFVNEIKIVGLNNAGGSPGYDVVNVRALTAGLVDLDDGNEFEGTERGDEIDLGDGNDSFRGGAGKDEVSGGNGRHRLFGQAGDDDLSGGKGADRMFGGSGDDRIVGGKGNDLASGGRGSDEFVFSKRSGDDVVVDFEVGVDVFTVNGGSRLLNRVTVEDADDGGTLVSFGKSSVMLEGVDAGAFSDATDFG